MQRQLVQALVHDIAHDLVVKLPKKKLLWMLGFKYDKPGAWAELLEIWAEEGYSRSCLMGFEEREQIVLCSVTDGVEPVEGWA